MASETKGIVLKSLAVLVLLQATERTCEAITEAAVSDAPEGRIEDIADVDDALFVTGDEGSDL